MTAAPLNARQQRFVAEYLVDCNATRAAEAAGYSARTAKSQASRLLTNVNVSVAIQKLQAKRLERLELTANNVLEQLRRLVMFDPATIYGPGGRLLPIHEMPPEARTALAGIETDELYDGEGEDRKHVGATTKVKFWNRNEAVKAAMAHLALLAPTDIRISGEIKMRAMTDDDIRTRATELLAKAAGVVIDFPKKTE